MGWSGGPLACAATTAPPPGVRRPLGPRAGDPGSARPVARRRIRWARRNVVMAHEPIPPYPKNAPGDFYVENDCCITCEAPYGEAPDLMAHDEEGDYPHCYFKRQPETPEEVERAVMACHVSCVRAVRYAGRNPKILKKFQELGSVDACDVLFPHEDKALP